MNKKVKSFTLAETLITLTIIGVIAALTVPNLISTYKKHVVETRLKEVYSVIQQALRMSEIDNGPTTTWRTLGYYGNTTAKSEDVLAWYNEYLAKYLSVAKIEKKPSQSEGLLLYFSNGSALYIQNYIYDMVFYPNAKDTNNKKIGVNSFYFNFRPIVTTNDTRDCETRYFEPYCWSYDGTEGSLYNNTFGCKPENKQPLLCTKVIQLNGWKIPKDYPFKF